MFQMIPHQCKNIFNAKSVYFSWEKQFFEEFSGSTLKTTYTNWKPPESMRERSFFHLQVSVKTIKGDLEEEDCSPPALFLQERTRRGTLRLKLNQPVEGVPHYHHNPASSSDSLSSFTPWFSVLRTSSINNTRLRCLLHFPSSCKPTVQPQNSYRLSKQNNKTNYWAGRIWYITHHPIFNFAFKALILFSFFICFG